MAQAKSGDTVRVHYTGTLENGSQFDSSVGRDPLEFTLGSGGIIAGFENAVLGMGPGENKTVNLPPEEAYGPHNAELVQKVDRQMIPEAIDLQTGLQLQAQGPDGEPVVLIVREFDDDFVILDANHPLAGETLIFELELVEIK